MTSGVRLEARPFPYLLLPVMWATRNRSARRQRGDMLRGFLLVALAVVVCGALFAGSFWLTWQVSRYAELGDYLIRLGLSWLFLTLLSFLAFSGLVASLSTFFLSDDLRLLLAAPIASRRLFHARFARTLAQASWMVAVFLVPVLTGVGLAKCARPEFYVTAVLTVIPFVTIPVAIGTAMTLVLVNVFPARRARDILMFTGLLFAASLVMLLRFLQPERLLRIESLPDITDFFAGLQAPVTPLLPSFWAGEALFASLRGGRDLLHTAALWTTACALIVAVGAACERWHFVGYSKSQEARKARFTRLSALDALVRFLPVSIARRQLLVKDAKVFLRDVSQWSQLLLLVALMLVYLYNFRVLDLDRIPYMSGVVKNVYALVNLAMAGLVMATVCVRFVFPAVSAEGPAFWIIRTAPITARDFLWSKFWTGFVPVFVLTETLTVAANYFLNVDPLLKLTSALTIGFLSIALVGLAIGLGAVYPRFNAENPTQVASSYGGVTFMILAVCLVIAACVLVGWPTSILLWHRVRGVSLDAGQQLMIGGLLTLVVILTLATCLVAMRTGVRSLERN